MNMLDLTPGDLGRIIGFKVNTDDADRETVDILEALGFVPGESFKVVRRGLLGEPIAVEIRGTTIALGKNEAALIEIEALNKGNH